MSKCFRCSMEEITEYAKIEFDKLDALFAKQEKKFGTETVPTHCPEHYLNTWAKEAMLMIRKSNVRWLVMFFFCFAISFLFAGGWTNCQGAQYNAESVAWHLQGLSKSCGQYQSAREIAWSVPMSSSQRPTSSVEKVKKTYRKFCSLNTMVVLTTLPT